MEEPVTLSERIRCAAEEGIARRFGAVNVCVVAVENFPYSSVFRCHLQADDSGVPVSVIVRIPREGTAARPSGDGLGNERAALEYLTSISSTLAPGFLAGSESDGFVATEDFGTAPSVLELLLGNDAKAATEAAHAFARSLGRLHAQTAGNTRSTRELTWATVAIEQSWRQIREAVAMLGLPNPDDAEGVERDIREIARILNEPGDFLALSNGDPSVVNCKVIGGHVRFFDFEAACFRHALVDASVLRFFYPTGGPPWQLPPELAHHMEEMYRAELARACPPIGEDAFYERGMAAASAAWAILRMLRLPRVDAGPDQDLWPLLPPDWVGPIPVRSRRRQLVSILETFVASAERARAFTALAAWCEKVAEALRDRWPEAMGELPLYPAIKMIPRGM